MSTRTALLFIATAGFCVATLGAAGLQDVDALTSWRTGEPTPRAFWPLVLVVAGLVTLIVSGVATRTKGTSAAGNARDVGDLHGEYDDLLALVAARVDGLLDDAPDLDREQMLHRLDAISERDLFALTSRHEEIAAVLGFTGYARVWDGVATAERYLARAWSLTTDGHQQAAVETLPVVQSRLAEARKALSEV